MGVEDGNQNRTTYRLDAWGRITGIVKADGSMEYYAYDYAGNMTSSTDGEGHTTQYEYNVAGQVRAIIDPTGERETYLYDGEDRLISRTDRNGVTVLLVEQNAQMALSISDRAYVLETGHITIEGDAKALLNDERVKKAYLGQ